MPKRLPLPKPLAETFSFLKKITPRQRLIIAILMIACFLLGYFASLLWGLMKVLTK